MTYKVQKYFHLEDNVSLASDVQPATVNDDEMNCKYCTYKGPIFSLRKHIMNKLKCKNKYTQDDLLEIEKIYEPLKQEKRKISRANYHQRNKRLKETKVMNFT